MLSSLRSRLYRIGFNLFPAYRRTGGRVTYVAPDWQEIRIKLPLNWRTRNYVGTTFGGSIYGAVDPFYMMMLLKTLGDEYVVWDKEAEIRFKKPGRDTLYARFTITDEEIAAIRSELETEGRSRSTATTRSTSSTPTAPSTRPSGRRCT